MNHHSRNQNMILKISQIFYQFAHRVECDGEQIQGYSNTLSQVNYALILIVLYKSQSITKIIFSLPIYVMDLIQM
jgi:hypothetical protein